MDRFLKIARAAILILATAGSIVLGVQVEQLLNQAQATLRSATENMDAMRSDLERMQEHVAGTLEGTDMAIAVVTQTAADVQPTLQAARGTMQAATGVMDAAHTTVDQVNRKDGILKQTYALLYDARLTLDNVNDGALDEKHYMEATLPQITSRVESTLDNADSLVAHTDQVVTSPELKESMASAADALKQGDGLLADGKLEADKFAHPPPRHWYQKVWNGTKDAGILVYDFVR